MHELTEVVHFGESNSHLQMSVISVGTGSSLVSLGIRAKPPRAYRKPPMEIKLRELRSWGNPVNSDHLGQKVPVNARRSADQRLNYWTIPSAQQRLRDLITTQSGRMSR